MQSISMNRSTIQSRWQPGWGDTAQPARAQAVWAPPPPRLGSPYVAPRRALGQEEKPALASTVTSLAFDAAAAVTGLVFWARMPAGTVWDGFTYVAAGTALVFGLRAVGDLMDLTQAR